eukprot:702345-Prymnesium_polylepis.1
MRCDPPTALRVHSLAEPRHACAHAPHSIEQRVFRRPLQRGDRRHHPGRAADGHCRAAVLQLQGASAGGPLQDDHPDDGPQGPEGVSGRSDGGGGLGDWAESFLLLRAGSLIWSGMRCQAGWHGVA